MILEIVKNLLETIADVHNFERDTGVGCNHRRLCMNQVMLVVRVVVAVECSRCPDTERAQQPTTEENEATVKRQRKSRNQKPSTKQATRGGRHGGKKTSGFQTLGAFTAKSQRVFQLSAPSGRKASVFLFSAPLWGESQSTSKLQACSLASLFPVRGTPWLVPGFGWGFPIMLTTSTHTPHTTPSQLLLLTCHRTRNRRFCISVWSFLSQPLQQPQPIRARGH